MLGVVGVEVGQQPCAVQYVGIDHPALPGADYALLMRSAVKDGTTAQIKKAPRSRASAMAWWMTHTGRPPRGWQYAETAACSRADTPPGYQDSFQRL